MEQVYNVEAPVWTWLMEIDTFNTLKALQF